jgi:hypothetical protein
MKLQKLGGYAVFVSMFASFAYVALMLSINPLDDWHDPAKMMAAVSSAHIKFYLLSLLWIAGSILALIVYIALYERMHADAPYLTFLMIAGALTNVAMAIAEAIISLKSVAFIIPQQDISAFRACWVVTQGLHWAFGHICAWVLLLQGCAILKTRAFSQILGGLFLLAGILWIPNFFFVQIGFKLLTPIYLLLACIGSIWIGIALLRLKQPQSASR